MMKARCDLFRHPAAAAGLGCRMKSLMLDRFFVWNTLVKDRQEYGCLRQAPIVKSVMDLELEDPMGTFLEARHVDVEASQMR